MTPTETFQRQYPLALQALGLHMQIHELPAIAAIDTVDYHAFGDVVQARKAIRLRLPAFVDQQAKWVESVLVDGVETDEVEYGFKSTWFVRLPDTGFRFELVGLQSHPLHSVVPA